MQTSEKQLTIFIALFNIAAPRNVITFLTAISDSFSKILLLVYQIFLIHQKAE